MKFTLHFSDGIGDMEVEDIRKLAKILSISYLMRKNGKLPTESEIQSEERRREAWINECYMRASGMEGSANVKFQIWVDPPDDFNVNKIN